MSVTETFKWPKIDDLYAKNFIELTNMPNRIAISMGDYNGIGPEIILKALTQIDYTRSTPVILGSHKVFEFYAKQLNLPLDTIHVISTFKNIEDGKANLIQCVDSEFKIKPGRTTKQAGLAAMQAVEAGIELCMSGKTKALITAPISKEAVNRAGYHIPGHTEFLAQKTNTARFMMLLVHEALRVGLVTTHIPVAKVAAAIQTESVFSSINTMHHVLKNDFNIGAPKIAVLGLNPHAGDGGVIGNEEIEQIIPAIEQAKNIGINTTGPHPADGFFGNKKYKQVDGVLSMYHDQGLVPFKALSFGGGVNVTGGLPFVRTSPDHGTAFDIAGKNMADSSSFLAAYKLAEQLSKNRN